jgi:hypothetical protein
MSLHDDYLQKECPTWNGWLIGTVLVSHMVVRGFSSDCLEELSAKRGKDTLEQHEGVLGNLSWHVDIADSIKVDRRKRDYTIVLQEAMAGNHSLDINWHSEDPGPTLDLGPGFQEIQEDLKLGRVLKVE